MKSFELIWNGKFKGLPGALILFLGSVYNSIKDKLTTIIVKNNLKKVGKNVQIHGGITYRYPKNITLGNNIVIARGVTLISENKEAELVIGDNVIITFDSRLDFSGGLTIGKNSLISKNTIIETHDHGLDPHSEPEFKKLDIAENVWIGMNVLILSGVRKIGANSVIAAGSVVTKEVPPNCIVGGIPAKIIKQK